MAKQYIDIRLHVEELFEDFGDESYTSHVISGVERIKAKGLDENQIDGLAEHVAQEEKYQIYLHPAIANALSGGLVEL